MSTQAQSDLQFLSAISRFINEGGTFPRARALIDEAEARLSGREQMNPASQAMSVSTSDRGGADHGWPDPHTRPVHPVREPTSADRQASAQAAKHAAITIMETMEVRGRGPWASIAVGSLHAIAVEGTRDASIAKQLMAEVPIGTSTSKSVKDVISLAVFQRAVQRAAEIVDREVGDAA